VTVTADNQHDAIDNAAFFQNLPDACPECTAPVVFFARHPKGFHYYGIRCTGTPQHESSFGIHKEGGGLFYKEREAWTSYRGGNVDPDFDEPAGSPRGYEEHDRARWAGPADPEEPADDDAREANRLEKERRLKQLAAQKRIPLKDALDSKGYKGVSSLPEDELDRWLERAVAAPVTAAAASDRERRT
jgi:hypothetical protein